MRPPGRAPTTWAARCASAPTPSASSASRRPWSSAATSDPSPSGGRFGGSSRRSDRQNAGSADAGEGEELLVAGLLVHLEAPAQAFGQQGTTLVGAADDQF